MNPDYSLADWVSYRGTLNTGDCGARLGFVEGDDCGCTFQY